MPKMKTNSGAKKRFNFTGSGKIKRKHESKSHLLRKKSKKQKRNLVKSDVIHSADESRVRTLLSK
jgi:large subunit ribosomal protein L35